MTPLEPILVEVTRGDMVENIHQGSIVVMDAMGSVINSWGDPDKMIYARSALKLLQAIPLIETGAADAFGVQDEEVSLACASHSSSKEHIERVRAWLDRLGLSETDLECGLCAPIGIAESRGFLLSGRPLTPLIHPCSGKHAGFLTTALHMKENSKGYGDRHHPVQQRIEAVVSEMAEFNLARAPSGIDGCCIPVFGFPLKNLALAIAKFANPKGLSLKRAEAVNRIVRSLQKHPKMLAGEKRFETVLMETLKGDVIVKSGAEGVYVAILPSLGYGAALKINDGSAHASEVACGALLQHLGVLPESARVPLSPILQPQILNHVGEVVGERRAVFV